MERGSLGMKYTDRTPALDKHIARMFELRDPESSPFAPQMFGNAGRDHMEKYGSKPEHYVWIGWKNHKHSVNNPYAQFQTEYTLEEIRDAPMIHEPLTKLQCSPTSDGAGAAIVASERFVDEHGLWDQAIEIAGQAMVTDLLELVRRGRRLHQDRRLRHEQGGCPPAYEEAQVGPEDVQVIELHDCFSANELITYEALGLAAEGEGHKLVEARRRRTAATARSSTRAAADLQGPPARRHRARPVLGAHLAAAGPGRQASGRQRRGRAAAQHRAGRRGGGVDL